MSILHCGDFRLSLDCPRVMGIVNLTVDSFSGDGVGADVARAIEHAELQRDAGADILDIGAESTRPGATPIPVDEELARLLPVLRAIRDWQLPVSVDTNKPAVMRAVIDEGAALINDIAALREPGAIEAIAASRVGVCLMHMQGEPRTMQTNPAYADVVGEVAEFLAGRVAACAASGIEKERLLVDPGFGFGKTVKHNFTLLRDLGRLQAIGVPVLAGLSRKSMLGSVTGQPNGVARLPASVAAAVLAVERGASVVRAHDVAATRDALAVWSATAGEEC